MPAECFTYMMSTFNEHIIILITYMLKLRVGEMASFVENCLQTQIGASRF